MQRYDKSLQLTASGENIQFAHRVALGFVGVGLLFFGVAAFGSSGNRPGTFVALGLLSLVIGLFTYYIRHITAPTTALGRGQKVGLWMLLGGLFFSAVALGGPGGWLPAVFFWLTFGLVIIGGLVYIYHTYGRSAPGIKHDGLMQSPTTARGAFGWILGIVLTGGYVLLYWFPGTLEGLVRTVDPLSYVMRGRAADQWFLYGTIYTVAVLVMGVRAILKYRHSRYQIIRTFSVMFVQLGLAWALPAILLLLNQPEFYFSYFWPLDYDVLFPSSVGALLNERGALGVFFLFWGLVMTFIATPVLTYFFGKRWYCSWVCGCGGLAETAGDPFRHLSDKSLKAWQIERWMVHSVLVFIVVTTGVLWVNSATEGAVLGSFSGTFASIYGFLIGSVFAGVIGVGFYPLMGSRVWCRFGCPMAAVLGLLQKYFSRFRITTNGGQCISCGNCSTYCEMGIDVRWYAQRGQNIIRASCVGCGVCSSVCPRGVLRLENGPRTDRYNGPVLIQHDRVSVQLDESWKQQRPVMPPQQEDIPVMTDADWIRMQEA
ncbi:MAG TPA: 4Fe-4S dicluster domain-containing protein [Rhodothermales bacterium]|nr:4Fe-4S dicluster domain-containing protein [Rhodothermales bacterium]